MSVEEAIVSNICFVPTLACASLLLLVFLLEIAIIPFRLIRGVVDAIVDVLRGRKHD